MTVREAQTILKTAVSAHFDERERDAITGILMEEITGLSRSDRLVAGNFELSKQEEGKLSDLLPKLALATPVQYLLNQAWFMGHKFFVDQSVLIPRPETEELVQWIINDQKSSTEPDIMDIGTGSGCIAISLKLALPTAHVHACDVSSKAIAVAAKNARELQADVDFIETDILLWQQQDFRLYDVIVSNPPYIPVIERASMHDNVVQHEPGLALFVPNDDALVFYRTIIAMADEHLATEGFIYFEVHEARAEDVRALFNENFIVTIQKDLQGKDRMVRAKKT